MKQQEKNREQDDQDDLLAALGETSESELRSGFNRVEGITEGDEQAHSRWLNSQTRRLRIKLMSWFLHFLFVVLCSSVLLFTLGTFYLTYLWINSFLDDPKQIGELLEKLWNVGLVALATLFIQSIVPKDK